MAVDPQFTIAVSPHFAEDVTHDYSLKKNSGKRILLPFGDVHQPLKENFLWHWERVFKK